MHGFIGLFLCLLWGFQASAQSEFSSLGSTLPPAGSGLNSPKVIKPTMFPPKAEQKSHSSSMIEDPKLQFKKNNDFANPGDEQKDKLNARQLEFSPNYVDKNVSLGVLHTQSDEVKLCYRDYEELDGDYVSIYTTDMILTSNALLGLECKYIKLGLFKGANTIYFQALNEGLGPPNTGELQIIDHTGTVIFSNRWTLETGFKATVTIYRD